jgi:hypothetical protein
MMRSSSSLRRKRQEQEAPAPTQFHASMLEPVSHGLINRSAQPAATW